MLNILPIPDQGVDEWLPLQKEKPTEAALLSESFDLEVLEGPSQEPHGSYF